MDWPTIALFIFGGAFLLLLFWYAIGIASGKIKEAPDDWHAPYRRRPPWRKP